MSYRTIRLAFLVVCLSAGVRSEARPQVFDFQGCLSDSAGAPLEDGPYAVYLAAYGDPDGTEPLWQSDGLINVTVSSGCFRHLLGTSNPLPDTLYAHAGIWVGIRLGSAQEQPSRVFVELPAPAPPPDSTIQAEDVGLDSAVSPVTQPSKPATALKRSPVPHFYAHFGGSFGFGGMGRGDIYKVIVDPFKPTVGLGYTVGVSVGFRNIYQLQYRPRSVASVDLFASDFNVRIPMALHIRDLFIHKLNLLAFKKPGRSGATTLFICYGTGSGGSVRHVDEVGDGFLNGSDKMFGLEFGILDRIGEVSFLAERHAVKFSSFDISGVGALIGEIEASFWYFGLQFAFGPSF